MKRPINKKLTHANKEKLVNSKGIRWAITFFLMFIMYEIVIQYAEPRLLPVRHIKMDTQVERVDLAALQQRILPHIRGFFSTNAMALKQDILKDPFIDEVIIKRIWPDTLLVSLKELTIIASWGDKEAVSSKGDVLPVKVDPDKHLPIFLGPSGQAAKILEQYNAFVTILRPFNMSISEINLNLRQSWQITLDNGLRILLGRKDLIEHLNSFVSVYPKLKKIHGENLESVDLRHSNGISVHLLKHI